MWLKQRQPISASRDTSENGDFDADYYAWNGQDGDRPALWWYERLLTRFAPSGPYLDWGCGTGWLLRRLSRHGNAAGFEISAHAAQAARTNSPMSTVFLDLNEIPAERYAGIAAIHLIEHLHDSELESLLATWRRVAVPNGFVLIATPDLNGRAHQFRGPQWRGFLDPTHVNLKSFAEWRRFLLESGMTPICEGSDGLWDGPYTTNRPIEGLVRQVKPAATILSGRTVLSPGSGESYVAVWQFN
jgi:SAM-dependent methyltransferase